MAGRGEKNRGRAVTGGTRLPRPMIEVKRLTGAEVTPHLDDLARMRIEVFREYPYLYEGSEGYERGYLESYAASPRSVFVLALDGGEVVGVSTGLPLLEAGDSFNAPFVAAGIDPATVFYFGESVLRAGARGQGIGHRFFDEREAHAAALGFPVTAFCAVERPADHPLKPDGYRPHDAFWGKRGYVKRPAIQARFSWQQIDAADKVPNVLTFWTRG